MFSDKDDRVILTTAATSNAVASSPHTTLAPNAIASSSGMAVAATAGSYLNPIAVDEDEPKGGFLGFIDLT
jgi:Holliday junction resolvase YEN1